MHQVCTKTMTFKKNKNSSPSQNRTGCHSLPNLGGRLVRFHGICHWTINQPWISHYQPLNSRLLTVNQPFMNHYDHFSQAGRKFLTVHSSRPSGKKCWFALCKKMLGRAPLEKTHITSMSSQCINCKLSHLKQGCDGLRWAARKSSRS